MSDVLQSGHPDADELTAFMEHELPEEARERTLAHLAVCPDCRMVVMLAAGAEEGPVEAVAPVAARWWWWRWQWGLAPAVVTVVLVAVTVRRETVPGRPAPVERAGVMVPAPPVPPMASPSPVPARQKAVVSGKEVAELPAVGRDAAAAAAPAAAAPAAAAPPVASMAGMAMGGSGAGVGAVAVPQPAAASLGVAPSPAPAPVVAAAVASGSTGFAAAPEELGRVMAAAPMMAPLKAARVVRPLPSGLATVSEASSAGATLALDGGNHVYVTRDGGAHWVEVAAQWSGKAVRVGLVGAGSSMGGPVSVDAGASATVITGAALDSVGSGAAVSGVVTDPGGAVIPGAVVTLSDAATKAVVRTAVTDKSGRYAIAAPAGNYSLEAQKAGFSRDVVTLAVAGKAVTANMGLAVGAESTTVEVQASNADLQTLNGETAQMLGGNKKAKAPMLAKQRDVAKVEPVFELVTENGEHWVSSDGSLWKKK